MSSLKIDRVVESLPENKYNIAESMRKQGYAQSSTRSGAQYARIRKAVEKYYNPDTIKAKIVKAEKKFIKDNDNSNLQANLTLQAKIVGLTKDSISLNQGIFNGLSTKDQSDLPKVEPRTEVLEDAKPAS